MDQYFRGVKDARPLKRMRLNRDASIGMELHRIHIGELFKPLTWRDYVRKRFNLNESRAFELIRLGQRFRDIVSTCREMGLPAPENEWQIRPLLKLRPPKAAVEAWIKIASKAKERNVRITGEDVAIKAALFGKRHRAEKLRGQKSRELRIRGVRSL